MSKKIYFSQTELMDCGPACLKMICIYLKKNISIEYIKNICKLTTNGTSLYNLQQSSRSIGIDCTATKLTLFELYTVVTLPCILFFHGAHYVVIPPQDITKDSVIIYDPNQTGIRTIDIKELVHSWIVGNEKKGYALIFGTK